MRFKLLTPVIVAVTALALGLALGSAGTATAGGLTKTAVKKIATKVTSKAIKKKAPGLSVAHAASADTATTATTAATATNAQSLGGQPAGAYRTTAYRYTIPAQPASGARTYSFPNLPAGTYVVDYALVFSLADVSGTPQVSCQVQRDPSSSTGYAAVSLADVFNGAAVLSASDSLTIGAGDTPGMACGVLGATISAATGPYTNTVTFTRVDAVTDQLAPAATPNLAPSVGGHDLLPGQR